ncbi:MAG: aminomethyl-transferring glycine dehydrogenase subunit GcvPA [Proteobacteria bacterium]|nr:aminomethyl-transferring glycine dehydrogenase subunit GcvPA [Pseudomonadota bacterium]
MRYIPHSEADVQLMLKKIGVSSIDELFEEIPESVRFKGELNLSSPMSEIELMTHLQELAGPTPAEGRISFMGAGAYCHHIPPAVDQILLRSEFYTSYTPYQPEVSQGTLQAIFEFQTMICRIFGMGVANASMYDGATAAAEAGLMARRVTKRGRLLVSAGLHPEYREVIRSYLVGLDNDEPNINIVPLDPETGTTDMDALSDLLGDDVCAVLIGYPNFFGIIDKLDEAAAMARAAGALAVSVTTEPFSLGVLATPGELGVDIAVGEGQSLGVPVSYGGPGVGLFACLEDRKLLRQMPGRLVGQTKDVNGQTGYVLTLSTREQHIRREKATSNICTNHGLCALSVTVNLSLLGKVGFEKVAKSCLARSEYLKKEIASLKGMSIHYLGPTFNEFAVRLNGRKAKDVLSELVHAGFLGGVDLGRFDLEMDDTLLIAVTECHTRKMLDDFVAALGNI